MTGRPFPFDPPGRNPMRRYRHRPRPCPGCGEPMAAGDEVAVWGPLPYPRTARRRSGAYRPAAALAHVRCIAAMGGTFTA